MRGTHQLKTTEGEVKTWKEIGQKKGTHKLQTTDGGTSQDMERKWPYKGCSPTRDHRGRDKSGDEKKVT